MFKSIAKVYQIPTFRRLTAPIVTLILVALPACNKGGISASGGGHNSGNASSLAGTSGSVGFLTQALDVAGPGVCSGVVTVGSTSTFSADTTVNLNANPASAMVFFTDSNCLQFPTTSVTIPAGQSSASFYFRSWQSGSVTISASGSGLNTASQAENIKPSTAPAISSPASLQVNLGPVSIDDYDGFTLNTQYPNCSSSWTVRQCVQEELANYAAQGVTGIRFMFGLAGGGHSTGINPTTGALSQTWVNNFNLFIQDVKNAGIASVTPQSAFGDFNSIKSVYEEVLNPCTNKNTYLGFNPTLPYGYDVATTSLTAAVSATTSSTQDISVADTSSFGSTGSTGWGSFDNPGATDAQGFGYTVINSTTLEVHPGAFKSFPSGLTIFRTADDGNIDQGGNNQAYNCSPKNPYFVGWPAIETLFDAVFAAIQNANLELYEWDVDQEIDLQWFTLQARFIYDNTSDTDVLTDIRNMASNHGFAPGRITYSGYTANVSSAGFDCQSVYGDDARLYVLSALVGAIAGAPNGGMVGIAPDANIQNGLDCDQGHSTSTMLQIPVGHTLPDIIDAHSYSCVNNPSGGGCDTTVSDSSLVMDATVIFNGMRAFQTNHGLSSTSAAVIGEMWSWSGALGGTPPEGATQPPNAVQDFIQGYLQSNMAGHPLVFRPWNDMGDTTYAFPEPIQPAYRAPAIMRPPQPPAPSINNGGVVYQTVTGDDTYFSIYGMNFGTVGAHVLLTCPDQKIQATVSYQSNELTNAYVPTSVQGPCTATLVVPGGTAVSQSFSLLPGSSPTATPMASSSPSPTPTPTPTAKPTPTATPTPPTSTTPEITGVTYGGAAGPSSYLNIAGVNFQSYGNTAQYNCGAGWMAASPAGTGGQSVTFLQISFPATSGARTCSVQVTANGLMSNVYSNINLPGLGPVITGIVNGGTAGGQSYLNITGTSFQSDGNTAQYNCGAGWLAASPAGAGGQSTTFLQISFPSASAGSALRTCQVQVKANGFLSNIFTATSVP